MTAPSTTAPPTGGPRTAPQPRSASVRRELLGLGGALAVALVAVAHLCLTPRAWILFSDADSVLLPLMHASRAAGEPQQWALSSVLFLPERALYELTAALGLGVRASLAIDAVVNLVLLYASFRLVAAWLRRDSPVARVGAALIALTVFAGFTLLDSSAAWDSFELPSLLATTTYYSATTLGTVLAVGLGATVLAGPRRRAVPGVLALAALTALSVLTNPLFLAWAAVPLALVAVLLTVVRRIRPRRAGLVGAAFAAGAAVGMLLRIPFASVIVRDPGQYADPSNALPTLAYLAHDLVTRLATADGVASVTAIDTLIVLEAVLAVQAIRARRTTAAVLFAVGALGPVALTAGIVVLGMPAVRYLQPTWLLPLIPIVLLPVPPRLPAFVRGRAFRLAGAAVVAALGIAGLGVTAATAATPDASMSCLDRWISASGRTGAGLFETIRGPKALLADPRQLIQVDSALHAQTWLADRADYRVRRVSFLVTDATTPPFATGTAGPPRRTVTCGRYRVLDWGTPALSVSTGGPIAPPHPASTTDGTLPEP